MTQPSFLQQVEHATLLITITIANIRRKAMPSKLKTPAVYKSFCSSSHSSLFLDVKQMLVEGKGFFNVILPQFWWATSMAITVRNTQNGLLLVRVRSSSHPASTVILGLIAEELPEAHTRRRHLFPNEQQPWWFFALSVVRTFTTVNLRLEPVLAHAAQLTAWHATCGRVCV